MESLAEAQLLARRNFYIQQVDYQTPPSHKGRRVRQLYLIISPILLIIFDKESGRCSFFSKYLEPKLGMLLCKSATCPRRTFLLRCPSSNFISSIQSSIINKSKIIMIKPKQKVFIVINSYDFFRDKI